MSNMSGGGGATGTHIHFVITGEYFATNNTSTCTSSSTTYSLCMDLTNWVCSGPGCITGFQMNTNSTQGFPDELWCTATFLYSFSAAVIDTAFIQLIDLDNQAISYIASPTNLATSIAGEKYIGAITGPFTMGRPGPTPTGDVVALRIRQSVTIGVTLTVNSINLSCHDLTVGGNTTPPVG